MTAFAKLHSNLPLTRPLTLQRGLLPLMMIDHEYARHNLVNLSNDAFKNDNWCVMLVINELTKNYQEHYLIIYLNRSQRKNAPDNLNRNMKMHTCILMSVTNCLIICILVSPADNFCIHFGPRSGPTFWSWSKIFDNLMVFLMFFLKKRVNFEKQSANDKKSIKIDSVQRVDIYYLLNC